MPQWACSATQVNSHLATFIGQNRVEPFRWRKQISTQWYTLTSFSSSSIKRTVYKVHRWGNLWNKHGVPFLIGLLQFIWIKYLYWLIFQTGHFQRITELHEIKGKINETMFDIITSHLWQKNRPWPSLHHKNFCGYQCKVQFSFMPTLMLESTV
jgi:hypothetical protein